MAYIKVLLNVALIIVIIGDYCFLDRHILNKLINKKNRQKENTTVYDRF